VLSATIFLSGGIVGTLHHLYFSGTPIVVIALGSVFSALEVVPLLFVGFEAWENLRPWVQKYRWPIYFFVSVAFWNLLGAGLFGFMINPPIALYYMHAGSQHDAGSCACRLVRRLWDARNRADALFRCARSTCCRSGRTASSGSGFGRRTSVSSPW
jgi:hypothetical protein